MGKDISPVCVQDEVLTAEFDPHEVIHVRERFPFLKDMRLP
jgi:predicted amidohydrolase